MAEAADVLTGAHQQVVLPDLNAGCSMADMADIDSVEEAWEALGEHVDISRVDPHHLHELRRRPEGLRRRNHGAVCTSPTPARCSSGPSQRAIRCSSSRPAPGPQHRLPDGLRRVRHAGLESPQGPRRGSLRPTCEAHVPALEGPLLGPPAVHHQHVADFRAAHPGGIVIAHPECSHEVCAASPIRSDRPSSSSEPSPRPGGLGDRRGHRDPHGQPHGQRDARQDGHLDRSARLPVLHDVPHRRPAPVRGCSRNWSPAGCRTGRRRRRRRRMGARRAAAHARHHLTARPTTAAPTVASTPDAIWPQRGRWGDVSLDESTLARRRRRRRRRSRLLGSRTSSATSSPATSMWLWTVCDLDVDRARRVLGRHTRRCNVTNDLDDDPAATHAFEAVAIATPAPYPLRHRPSVSRGRQARARREAARAGVGRRRPARGASRRTRPDPHVRPHVLLHAGRQRAFEVRDRRGHPRTTSSTSTRSASISASSNPTPTSSGTSSPTTSRFSTRSFRPESSRPRSRALGVDPDRRRSRPASATSR
jgi:hypothetical protein